MKKQTFIALLRLLYLCTLSYTGCSYPSTEPQRPLLNAPELLKKLQAQPEYTELAKIFSPLAAQSTRTPRTQIGAKKRAALIACMKTIEKLEEAYPSPLLTDVATWCATHIQPHKKLGRWRRNAIIIGSTAATAALTLAAIRYRHQKYVEQRRLDSLSYAEQLQYAINNEQTNSPLYKAALTLREAYRNPGSSQNDLESALAEALLASSPNPSLIAVISKLLPNDAQVKVKGQVASMKEKYSKKKQNLLSELFALRFQISKHKKLIQDAKKKLQKQPDQDQKRDIQTHIDRLNDTLVSLRQQEQQKQQQLK